MSNSQSPVLIVEDSQDDYDAIAASLQKAGVRNTLVRCHDGSELSNFLKQSRDHRSSQQPAVILLDLNLPGRNGHSILCEIRGDDRLGLVPVVMLSSSNAQSDVNLAYINGANSYLVKPLSLDEFEQLMRKFSSYWLETVVPPFPVAHSDD